MRPLDHFDCEIMAELQVRGDCLTSSSPAATPPTGPATPQRRPNRGNPSRHQSEKVGIVRRAFVLVTLTEHSEAGDAQFARALDSLPNVLRADAVTRADDVLLHIAAVDTRDLQDVLRTLPASAPDA